MDERTEAEVLEWRCMRALREAAELTVHVRSLMVPGNGQGERGEEDPRERAPLRVTPTDTADHLFANLLLWVDYWAEELGRGMPMSASMAWSNYREVQGFRAGTTAEAAGRLTAHVTGWLRLWAQDIARHPQGAVYQAEIVRLVGGVRGQFPLEERPERPVSPRPCPTCGETEVRADWWGVDEGDVEVRCSHCGWRADADYRALMAWIRAEAVEGKRVEDFDPSDPAHAALMHDRSSPNSGNTNNGGARP
jgi:predicted RNA-binding Zn-ribbon protein involved in translation (DUF1610 family)